MHETETSKKSLDYDHSPAHHIPLPLCDSFHSAKLSQLGLDCPKHTFPGHYFFQICNTKMVNPSNTYKEQ